MARFEVDFRYGCDCDFSGVTWPTVVDTLTDTVVCEAEDKTWAVTIAEALNASVTNVTQDDAQID